jgi:hypothetical protein
LDVLVAKSVVGLFSIWATFVRVKARKTFHLSKKPVVPLVEDEQQAFGGHVELPRFRGPPRLLAMARDPWTIFAYWNADWPSIFKNAAPVDQQVHLRVHCANGLEEKEATVEPMAGMHYITTSQQHRICRIEIGYYQPADVWHSVAMSNEITMPRTEMSDSENVDLATIPFHLSFQQLIDLFGVNDDALAMVMSRFQMGALSSQGYEKFSREERKTLRETGVALSELAYSQRAFNQIDHEKLKKCAEALVGSGGTSPSRGFKGDWTSGGS